MATAKEINEKYGTGQIYISPAALDYFDNKRRRSFWCKASITDIINEYDEHIKSPPTDRCHQIEVSRYGIFPPKNFHITDAELEWASLKGILESAVEKGGDDEGQVKFVVMIVGD